MSTDSEPFITAHQDTFPHKDRLYAYSRAYDLAARWRGARIWGSTLLATATFVYAFLQVGRPEWLGVVAAVYLVLARTLLRLFEDRARRHAARIQERYDVGLFRLSWNAALAGPEPLAEDIALDASAFRNSRRFSKNPTHFDNWYDINLGGLQWPDDVLMCQRYSAYWARSDHRAYSALLSATSVLLVWAIVVVSAVQDVTLRDFLILFLPVTPALLDLADTGRTHAAHSSAREATQRQLNELLNRTTRSAAEVPEVACRQVQDAALVYRMAVAPVPSWFYRARRAITSRVGQEGARQVRVDQDDL